MCENNNIKRFTTVDLFDIRFIEEKTVYSSCNIMCKPKREVSRILPWVLSDLNQCCDMEYISYQVFPSKTNMEYVASAWFLIKEAILYYNKSKLTVKTIPDPISNSFIDVFCLTKNEFMDIINSIISIILDAHSKIHIQGEKCVDSKFIDIASDDKFGKGQVIIAIRDIFNYICKNDIRSLSIVEFIEKTVLGNYYNDENRVVKISYDSFMNNVLVFDSTLTNRNKTYIGFKYNKVNEISKNILFLNLIDFSDCKCVNSLYNYAKVINERISKCNRITAYSKKYELDLISNFMGNYFAKNVRSLYFNSLNGFKEFLEEVIRIGAIYYKDINDTTSSSHRNFGTIFVPGFKLKVCAKNHSIKQEWK